MTEYICTRRGKDFLVQREASNGDCLTLWTEEVHDLRRGEVVTLDGTDPARVVEVSGRCVKLYVY